MEADWDFEIGPDLPSITVPWDGFIDLRNRADAATKEISEAAGHPALFDALITLNSPDSPVFTSKCDVWEIKQEEIDIYEFAARRESASRGFASYIDVILVDREKFQSLEFHELWVRRITEDLRARVLANCRADLVVRPATIHSLSGSGITIYAAGCGGDAPAAYAAWETVLQAAVDATMKVTRFAPARASSSIG
ncbi:MAG: hypothetical protein JOY95_02585 [Silvibacterium sp.]|nr:hypothetical protein [Silvibacterium sp.]